MTVIEKIERLDESDSQENDSDSSGLSSISSNLSFGWLMVKLKASMDQRGRNTFQNEVLDSDDESRSDHDSIDNEASIHFPITEDDRSGLGEEHSSSDSDSSTDGVNQSYCNKKTERKEGRTETYEQEGMTSEDETSDDKVDLHNQQNVPSLDDGLISVKSRGGLQIEHITEDDEAWMLQCPISLGIEDLKKIKLVFGETSDLTLKQNNCEQHYEISSHTNVNKAFTCFLPSKDRGYLVAKVFDPKGLIMIKERIDVPDFGNVLHKDKKLQFPIGLKQRHPLFGPDYKQELEQRNAVTRKKRRKNKKRKKSIGKTDVECESSPRKKKCKLDNENLPILLKEKHDPGASLSRNFEKGRIIMNNESEPIHKKKRKKDKNKDDFNEIHNDDEIIHKKKKKGKSNENESLQNEESTSANKRKKNKDSTDCIEFPFTNEEIQDTKSKSPHKKKKNKFKDNTDCIELPFTNKEIDGIEPRSEHKKKKSKFMDSKISIEFPFGNKAVLPESHEDTTEKPVKKKKKHKKEV